MSNDAFAESALICSATERCCALSLKAALPNSAQGAAGFATIRCALQGVESHSRAPRPKYGHRVQATCTESRRLLFGTKPASIPSVIMTAIEEFPVAAVSSVSRPYRILVCDDQPDVLRAIELLLKGAGYEAISVDSPGALLRRARSEDFDLILADLNYTRDTTSGDEGLDLLAGLEAQGNEAPVIVMTAWGSIDLAVEAMRRGACDFVQKPWDNARVLAAIRKQAASERRRQSEIEIAATVQQKLFPRDARPLRTIDYAGQCVTARGVGGDYYDFLDLGASSLGFVLAD